MHWIFAGQQIDDGGTPIRVHSPTPPKRYCMISLRIRWNNSIRLIATRTMSKKQQVPHKMHRDFSNPANKPLIYSERFAYLSQRLDVTMLTVWVRGLVHQYRQNNTNIEYYRCSNCNPRNKTHEQKLSSTGFPKIIISVMNRYKCIILTGYHKRWHRRKPSREPTARTRCARWQWNVVSLSRLEVENSLHFELLRSWWAVGRR